MLWNNKRNQDGVAVISNQFEKSFDSPFRRSVVKLKDLAKESRVVKFVESEETPCINITKSRCWSHVGRVPTESQDLSLGDECLTNGATQHKFMHAIRFWQKQSQPDRDEYVKAVVNNIVD